MNRKGGADATGDGNPVDPHPRLRPDLVRVGSMSTSHGVVAAALQLVTTVAAEAVDGADGVSVSLQRQGRLITVAASNEIVTRMDRHQYDTGEGPCVAASHGGRPFHIESLAEEPRWPQFVPRAAKEGIGSILSTPLVAATGSVGAVNMYSTRERAFGPRQLGLAALLAAQATIVLDAVQGLGTDEEVDRRILDGLHAREVIARAQGVIMEREQLSAEAAADTLHRAARTNETTVMTEAERLVASTLHRPRTRRGTSS